MRSLTMMVRSLSLLALCLLASAAPARADRPLDCSKESLADAVANARDKDPVIAFTGTCAGPIVIRTDGVTLQGVNTAIIDGGGRDAVTINTIRDLQLTFGARADLQTLVFGTATCDATVLVRGNSGIICPQ